MYGKLPPKKNLLGQKLNVPSLLPTPHCILATELDTNFLVQDRKYFDSGDYMLSKAGKTPNDAIAGTTPQIGSQIPSPESIPHSSAANSAPGHQGVSSSPVKESLLASPPMELTISERGG
jgi:cAMP-regulated phosphoprotein/endosulfine conserved region